MSPLGIFVAMYFSSFPASSSTEAGLVEANGATQPVKIGFRMVRCHVLEPRCPQISVQMNEQAYRLLNNPYKVRWHYVAHHANTNCKAISVDGTVDGIIGFSCEVKDLKKTHTVNVKAQINGLDPGEVEYFALQTGAPQDPGVWFELTEVCLLNGQGDNCMKVTLKGTSYKNPFTYRTLDFPVPD